MSKIYVVKDCRHCPHCKSEANEGCLTFRCFALSRPKLLVSIESIPQDCPLEDE